jgi:hypothetical protein
MEIQEKITVISGLSVGNIVLGADTSQIVIEEYGSVYDEINHNNYSIEMRYRDIGLSFYYLYGKALKIIFNIDVIPDKTRCIILKFMVIDRMIDKDKFSIQDAVNLFGSVDHIHYSYGDELASIVYPGIEFHANYDEYKNNVPMDKIIVKKVTIFNSEREV